MIDYYLQHLNFPAQASSAFLVCKTNETVQNMSKVCNSVVPKDIGEPGTRTSGGLLRNDRNDKNRNDNDGVIKQTPTAGPTPTSQPTSKPTTITRPAPTPTPKPTPTPTMRQKCSSMTLAISASNANRMLEASRALNASLKSQNTNDSVSITESIIPAAKMTSDQLLLSFVNSMEEEVNKSSLSKEEMIVCLLLFIDMDKSSKLLTAFEVLEQNDADTFLEKSNILDDHNGHDDTAKTKTKTTPTPTPTPTTASEEAGAVTIRVKKESNETHEEDQTMQQDEPANDHCGTLNDETKLPTLERLQMRKLFQSFLASISICIHYKDLGNKKDNTDQNYHNKTSNKAIKLENDDSPRSQSQSQSQQQHLQEGANNREDCSLISNDIRREIGDIANYAAEKVIEDVLKKRQNSPNKTQASQADNVTTNIEFQEFGDWYNSGGFSLVPWLELLDLAKWDRAGRAAAAASADSSAKKKSTQSLTSTTRRRKKDELPSSSLDVDTIMENSVANMAPCNIESGLSPAMPDLFLRSPALYTSSLNHPTQTSLSRVLISFDFAGSSKYQIKITRENLLQLQHLVTVTDLSRRSPGQVANVLLRHSKKSRVTSSPSLGAPNTTEESKMILSRQDFGHCIRDLIPSETLRHLSPSEMDSVLNRFTTFFLCFGNMNAKYKNRLGIDHVDAKELAVGLSFLCAGNKSAKLASTFELIKEPNFAHLCQRKLMSYLRSYLTMLVGVSILSTSESSTIETLNCLLAMEKCATTKTINDRMVRLFDTAEVGASWTLDHFVQKNKSRRERGYQGSNAYDNKIFFEDFASWYTDRGGYSIAPWLEFLDLKKFMSLLNDNNHEKFKSSTNPRGEVAPLNPPNASGKIRTFDECFAQSPLPQENSKTQCSVSERNQKDILFTFPLAKKESLVVLREDAAYVRTVVDHLGLLHLSPEDVWDCLFSYVKSNPPAALPYQFAKCHKSGSGKSADVDQKTFVEAIEKVLPSKSKEKRASSASLTATPQKTLENFFHSFDLDQVDRVSANQLMCGLTLLCGGKKSTKLAFAFGLFDMRKNTESKAKGKKSKKQQVKSSDKSLCGKELFYFLRSFLIVMFSCCKQSLDLSADAVGRYISDTANMVTDDVMKYQWRVKQGDRVNFDDFGEWYNEGGFETAPWLELLDLNKWVLLDQEKAEKLIAEAKPMRSRVGERQLKDKSNDLMLKISSTPTKISVPNEYNEKCPPPPPDVEIDEHADSFFDDIEMDGIGGDIGDMGFLFQEEIGKENIDQFHQEAAPAEPSPYRTVKTEIESKPLKFQLFTNESNVYTVSISPQRVQLLRLLVIESNLCNISISLACSKILGDDNGKQISRDRFDSAMHGIIGDSNMSEQSRGLLSNLLSSIFNAFDFNKLGKADATELACGLTVLCGGRKSDKLEYAFELLDKKKKGLVSRFQMVRYLQSFLSVLLNISSCALGSEPVEDILYNQEGKKAEGNIALARVICSTSSWATEEIFKATTNGRKEIQEGTTEHIDFDSFAEWYTGGGYNRIAWLELLDLRKWVLAES